MENAIKPGCLASFKSTGIIDEALMLQVTDLQETNGKLKCTFSDSKEDIPGVITSQVAREFGKVLKSNDVVKVTEGNINSINDKQVLIVAGMDIVQGVEKKSEDDSVVPVKMEDTGPTEEVKTPATNVKTSGKDVERGYATGPTPPSTDHGKKSKLASASKNRNVMPISALNPYIHGWSIRGKIVNKTPKRSFSGRGGASSSVFTVEIVDDQGGTIEGTFWREAADRFYDLMEVGKVYVMSKGSVKPANKKYSQTRNDYCLHFDNGCEVEAADVSDSAAAAMVASMNFVPVEQLTAFVDKKMTVDLLGIVISVGQLGSVKRKNDQSELSRRDITIVDRSMKTVVVTIWGEAAEKEGAELEKIAEAEGMEGAPVLAVSSCRVSSYNGVSVSALSRSSILINPEDMQEAQGIRTWWKLEGLSASSNFSAVGEGLPTSMKKSNGTARIRLDLETVRTEAPQKPEDKPVYSGVAAAITAINPEQSMWYLACPENNRKVVEQNGQYYCEWDGKTYSSATHRYILLARFADPSGELPVQIFNDQAETLLGRTADEMATLKESDPATFNALLSDASWTEWVLRIKAQAQEYNGEIRKRYAVADIKPMDYNLEARRTLDLISQNA